MTKEINKILTVFLLIFSFQNGFSKDKYLIGFSQCAQHADWRQNMEAEMERELMFHDDLSLVIKQAYDDANLQVQQINELMEMGIDLLIVSPYQISPVQPVIEEVYRKGIPVVFVDRKIDSDFYSAYVGGNNYEIGEVAANYIANRLANTGKIVEIMGGLNSSPAIERTLGFNQTLENYPEIQNIDKINTNESLEVISDKLPEIIKKDSNIKAIFAFNDDFAKIASTVISKSSLGKEVLIVGVDGLPNEGGGIEMVEEGILSATLIYPTGGKEAIEIASKILHGEPYEKENLLATTLVDPTNVDIIRKQFDKINSLQSDISKSQNMLLTLGERYKVQQFMLYFITGTFLLVILLMFLLFRSFNKLKDANHNLERQKEELKTLSDKLEKVTQEKLRFFTNISHEFRTPLTLIVGPLEDLLKSSGLPDDIRKRVGLMHKNALRLLQMINQLMDFRKIENAKMRLQAGNYNLVDFLNEVRESFLPLADNKQINLIFDTDLQELMAWFDWDKLDKVVFNLLSNAFKFTPEKGTIQIKLRKENPIVKSLWDEELVIEITDNGKGISPKHINHIFDRFYQVEKSDNFKGTGLGLALSKEFVELHHGRINVESAEGKKTTFTVKLPLGDAHLNRDEKVSDDVQKPIMHEQLVYNKIYLNPEIADRETGKETVSSERPRILLVEDDREVRSYIRECLEESYEILEAPNGKVALKMIEEEEPDLIVSDIMMPEMDGLELTHQLKNDLKTCHIPIILLSAKSSLEQRLEGLEEGADSYIPKPFSKDHLQIRIRKLLELRVKIHERYKSQHFIDEVPNDISRLDKKFLNRVSKIVEDNLQKDEFTVEELSDLVGLSRVQIYRKIKKLTGMSVSEYVRMVKLKASLELIRTSGKSMSEIAYEVGFSSPSYFAQCFKKQFGISPSDYAKK
ncbi:substrate-binding domain-containing protein [Gaoshiqia sediminis]|uniref:histidine kinase n=1 Tax=Gaoshiqia sediminis TaxID=2986998 RepID=A0AA42C9T7_9BACT|nr:substrate-binding domain-containing protein [Gaoshiqia sediminis]MCW0484456.1 substrate-binding domain-containing protein [Gaoshiqia sediminis]